MMYRILAVMAVAVAVPLFHSCCNTGYEELEARLEEITENEPCKVGVAVIVDNSDTLVFNNSADYPLMSMFKLHEALAVCHALDMRSAGLDLQFEVRREGLDPDTWSPMLKEHGEDRFTVTAAGLIEYILVHSDNNASNLLFDRVVSAPETDRYIRSVLPQDDFRILYRESDMKADIAKGYANCSSPLSYACLVNKVFTENIVSGQKQEFIKKAMSECRTGMSRIAAGLPEDARFAHRTGSGYVNELGEIIAVNDGGYVRLPTGKSYSIAVFVKDFAGIQEDAEKIIARISSAVYDYVSGTGPEEEVVYAKDMMVFGKLRNGEPVGVCECYPRDLSGWRTGHLYVGKLKDGKFDGKGVYYCNEIIEGRFRDGRLDGRARIWRPKDREVVECVIKDDEMQEPIKVYPDSLRCFRGKMPVRPQRVLTVDQRKYINPEILPISYREDKPSFGGGDANSFSKWVNKRLVYPEELKKKGVQGRVTLSFTVETDGSVDKVKVLRGVHPSLDAEAVRVVSLSPKWTPGKIYSTSGLYKKSVPITYVFPVVFSLPEKSVK